MPMRTTLALPVIADSILEKREQRIKPQPPPEVNLSRLATESSQKPLENRRVLWQEYRERGRWPICNGP